MKTKIYFNQTTKQTVHKSYQIAKDTANGNTLIEWDQNPFYACMEIKYFGYHIQLVDTETGFTHYMSQNLFNSSKNLKIFNRVISGKWKFTKRGTEVFLQFISPN